MEGQVHFMVHLLATKAREDSLYLHFEAVLMERMAISSFTGGINPPHCHPEMAVLDKTVF